MKKTKNKNLRRAIGFLALAALVAGLAAMPLLTKDAAAGEEYPVSILSAPAQRRELTRVFSGGGTLQAEDAVSVTVPQGVRLTEVLGKAFGVEYRIFAGGAERADKEVAGGLDAVYAAILPETVYKQNVRIWMP